MRSLSRRQLLNSGGRLALLGAALPLLGCLSACKTTDLTDIGVSAGVLDRQQAESLRRTVEGVARTFEDITPEQEYYLGRSVGATVLSRYPPYEQTAAEQYLNLLGTSLAQVSDRPETFGGYHFLLLASDEINAFAAPGGFIFISRGLLACCPHEAALAAVLAHEISHVQHRHGLQAIKRSRLASAIGILAMEGTKNFSGADLANLVRAFEDSITDITSTLINNGYSRALERQADQAAITILARRGYEPGALLEMLEEMQRRLPVDGPGFARTHPSPASRIEEIQSRLQEYRRPEPPAPRGQRFARFMALV